MSSILSDVRFLLIAATNFCLFLIVSTLSFLPVVVTELGGDKLDVGLVMGAIGITSLGSLPFLAPLIDRCGRKSFIVAGILIMGLSNGLFLFFESYSPAMLVVRLFQGLAFAACFNGCSTSIVDLVPPEKRAQGIGLYGVSGSLAVCVGPYIGETVLLDWGREAYFAMAVAFGVIGFLMGLCVREPDRAATRRDRAQGFFPTAANDGHFATMVTAMMFGSGFAVMVTSFPLYATELGLRAGIFFVCYGMSLIAVRIFLGHLADNMNRDRLILACLIGFGILILGTTQLVSVVHTVLLGSLFGVLQGLSYPALMARMVDRSTDQNRAVVVSLFTGSFGVGINLSVLAWGAIAKLTDLPFMFLAASMMMFAVAAVYWRSQWPGRTALYR